jgi:esterase/lipase
VDTKQKIMSTLKTNFEKVIANVKLAKLLKVTEVKTAFKKSFADTLALADNIGKANENWESEEVKTLLKSANISYANKYEYFKELTSYGKSYIAELLQVSKMSSQIVADYLKIDVISPSIKKLIAFSKPDSEINTTATKPIIDKTETKKPLKIKTKKSGIEITIHDGAEIVDFNEAIKKLQTMLKAKKTK